MKTDRAAAAEQRLAASREKIRSALAPRNSHDAEGNDGGAPSGLHHLKQLLASLPISRLAMRSLTRWWRQHPWRSRVNFVLDTTDAWVRPVAEKHPWWLVTGALVLGVVIARTRPWRLLSGGALLAGLLPQMRWATVIDWVSTLLRELPTREDRSHAPPPVPGDKV